MLRRICKYAAHFHLIRPLEIMVKLPQKSPKVLLPFTTEEQKKLQSFVMDEPTSRKIGLLLGFQLGLRIGEVCGLKWSDIDTKSKILTVQRTVSRIYLGKNNTRVEISTPKTRSSARQLPIPENFLPILRQLKKLYAGDAWFLSGNICKPVEPRCYRTSCLRARCDVKTISTLLGHASASTTLKRYVHTDWPHLVHEVNRIFTISARRSR